MQNVTAINHGDTYDNEANKIGSGNVGDGKRNVCVCLHVQIFLFTVVGGFGKYYFYVLN